MFSDFMVLTCTKAFYNVIWLGGIIYVLFLKNVNVADLNRMS